MQQLKGQGILFQMLAVTGKLSASDNMTRRKGIFGIKYRQIHTGKEKSVGGITRIQCGSRTFSLLSKVKMGPRPLGLTSCSKNKTRWLRDRLHSFGVRGEG